jgi:hypothetical protein
LFSPRQAGQDLPLNVRNLHDSVRPMSSESEVRPGVSLVRGETAPFDHGRWRESKRRAQQATPLGEQHLIALANLTLQRQSAG